MRPLICLVALACAASAASSAAVHSASERSFVVYKPNGEGHLSTDQVRAKLDSKAMTPEETMRVLQEHGRVVEELFGGFYVDDFTSLNYQPITSCTKWALDERSSACDKFQESDDGSNTYNNLLGLCRDLNQKVAEWCSDKMDYVEPQQTPEFALFRAANRGEREPLEVVESSLSDMGLNSSPDDVAYLLSKVEDKAAKIAGDLTVADFLKLNQFSFEQCRPGALKERAEFVQSLTPKRSVADKSGFDKDFYVQTALRFFSSRALSKVAALCAEFENHPQMNQMNDQFKSALKNAVAEDQAAPAGKPTEVSGSTPMEKFLLGIKPEVFEP